MKILIVEDEKHIRDLLVYHLEIKQHHVTACASAEEAEILVRTLTPQLLILDLMLPKKSGLDLCKEFKKNTNTKDTAILMLTAKSSKEDIVQGLELGADDYVTKPFDIKEVMARIDAIGRRVTSSTEKNNTFLYKNFKIDWARYQAFKSNQELSFTQSEFKILKALVSNQGRVLTRDQLLDIVNGEGKITIDRNIDVHILSIRKKCGPDLPLIDTIRGVGYRIHVY